MEELDSAIKSVGAAVKKLNAEAFDFYQNGDNFRGNIRCDAASRLAGDLERLIVARDYIALAIKK